MSILANNCSIVNEIDRKVTDSMTNKTFLEDFEMIEIGKVSATLAKLLQLLVSGRLTMMPPPRARARAQSLYFLIRENFVRAYFMSVIFILFCFCSLSNIRRRVNLLMVMRRGKLLMPCKILWKSRHVTS
jgi:hypothetical protein